MWARMWRRGEQGCASVVVVSGSGVVVGEAMGVVQAFLPRQREWREEGLRTSPAQAR